MTNASYWWLAAGLLVAAELISGTFYLLMLACGAVVAALMAHLGADPTWQWAGAGLAGGACVLIWRQWRMRSHSEAASALAADEALDIGERVQVQTWRADGSTSVKYRGAQWEAILAPGQIAQAGVFTIVEVHGSRLVLALAPND
jgi:membrane protein implicated in regulation of membrane protease activity